MKDKSKIIKKIIIILLICIVLIVIFKAVSSKKINFEEDYGVEIVEGSLDFDLNEVKKIASRSDYCLVKKCVEKFYDYYINNKEVYSLLDNEYISEFDIKEDEIKGKFGNFEKVTVDITRNVLF